MPSSPADPYATAFRSVSLAIIVIHLMVIADDLQNVFDDPDETSKPEENLKLAFDFTRYFG